MFDETNWTCLNLNLSNFLWGWLRLAISFLKVNYDHKKVTKA